MTEAVCLMGSLPVKWGLIIALFNPQPQHTEGTETSMLIYYIRACVAFSTDVQTTTQ